MNILITGGAGYIGSHAVDLMAGEDNNIYILDNLSRGFKEAIETLQTLHPNKITFIKSDLKDLFDVQKSIGHLDIDAVMHFAALCSVNESVENPRLYYTNNVLGTINLLEILLERGVKSIIFSSTCATYGESQYLPIDENHPQNPVNPYGQSKLDIEHILKDYKAAYGLNYAILRYFNVCGSSTSGSIGDSKKPSSLLMQNAVRGALGIEDFKLTCPTVETPDGSPIRDYIDVRDLVLAHKAALEYIQNNNTSDIFNLGTGKGYSVKEIVDMVEGITGKKIERVKGDERKGEYAALFASIEKARKLLDWEPKYTLKDSVESLVNWYTKHPNGWTN